MLLKQKLFMLTCVNLISTNFLCAGNDNKPLPGLADEETAPAVIQRRNSLSSPQSSWMTSQSKLKRLLKDFAEEDEVLNLAFQKVYDDTSEEVGISLINSVTLKYILSGYKTEDEIPAEAFQQLEDLGYLTSFGLSFEAKKNSGFTWRGLFIGKKAKDTNGSSSTSSTNKFLLQSEDGAQSTSDLTSFTSRIKHYFSKNTRDNESIDEQQPLLLSDNSIRRYSSCTSLLVKKNPGEEKEVNLFQKKFYGFYSGINGYEKNIEESQKICEEWAQTGEIKGIRLYLYCRIHGKAGYEKNPTLLKKYIKLMELLIRDRFVELLH